MTDVPLSPRRLPLTLADYLAIPENGEVRYELQEGIPIGSPSPVPEHQICIDALMHQLRDHIPMGLRAVPGIDVDLDLAPAWRLGFVRRPDLVVVSRTELTRRRRDGGVIRASELVLAVEVVSVGSVRMDHKVKRIEYADAGIPHYWVVDLDDRPQLTPYGLAGQVRYMDAGPVEGVFATTEPFPVRVDLDALV